MIIVQSLAKRFSNKNVFHNYNITIKEKRVCITGVNGQGKTTLLTILAGLESIDDGTIKIDGKVYSDLASLSSVVALASDKIPFPEFLTAKEIIELTRSSWHCSWPQQIIDDFNFSPQLNTLYGDLSSGNCKKLQLICAFLRKTKILLLDEPTAALEQGALKPLSDLIDHYDGQIIITCHEPTLFIKQGFILQALANEL